MTPEKPRRLGRGLEALMGSRAAQPTAAPSASEPSELQRIPLALIRPNPFQPRREFPEAELAELRASLKASGLLQPVVVRPMNGTFELISGERRYRAASQLGWQEIPAIVRPADERTMLTLALIENLQRADLNAVEEARGYQRLHAEFQLTHQQISEAVGKDRSTVSNLLRLLALPAQVLTMLEQAQLSMGHARALLALEDVEAIRRLAADIVARQLSVRDTERAVRVLVTATPEATAPTVVPRTAVVEQSISPAVRQIQDALRRALQTDVSIHLSTKEKGSINIAFYSSDDLDRVLDLILGPSWVDTRDE